MQHSKITIMLSIALLGAIVLMSLLPGSQRSDSTTAVDGYAESANPAIIEPADVTTPSENARLLDSSTNASNSEENQQVDSCIPIATFVQSPEAYRLDQWFLTWGAPPISNPQLSSRPYAHYDDAALRQLSEAGDVVALHELGLDLVWAALTENEKIPDYKTLFDVVGEATQYRRVVDMDKLEQGRGFLYESALGGELYAFIELGLTYSLEMLASQNAGSLTDEQRRELQIKSFGWGNAPESLISGLDSTFYQAALPEGAESEAAQLSADIVESFDHDRKNRGLDKEPLPSAPDELDGLLILCSH